MLAGRFRGNVFQQFEWVEYAENPFGAKLLLKSPTARILLGTAATDDRVGI
jgi:hypothetical protein